jgi:hypothetical protein
MAEQWPDERKALVKLAGCVPMIDVGANGAVIRKGDFGDARYTPRPVT